MKKMIFAISVTVSGILLICASLIGGGLVAGGMNTRTGLSLDIFDSGIAVIFTVIGSLLAIVGLVLAFTEAFNKKQ